MSRPKKEKGSRGDLRNPLIQADHPLGGFAEFLRERNLDWSQAALWVDPLNDDPDMALWIGRFICGYRDAHEEFHIGKNIFMRAVAEMTADEAEAVFLRIVKLKRNYEAHRHRNSWAYLAYRNYMVEYSEEPTRKHLKRFILSRPTIYKEAPQQNDFKAWERLWDAAGLSALAK